MKIAVTGATGHLGQLVVNGLVEKHNANDIVAIVRNQAKAQSLADKGVQIKVADYNDTDALEKALAGVDKVLLISSSEMGQRFTQHKNVIDSAKAAGVKYIAYTSAPRAATTTLALAPEHKETEAYILKSGLDYTLLRNNWYTENYAGQIDAARSTGAIMAAAGPGRVASASRADYAKGAVSVLLTDGHEGKTYELGGDKAWDYNELAATIGEVIGKPVEYKSVDKDTMKGILQSIGMDDVTAEVFATIDTNIADGELAEVTGDLNKLIGGPTTPLKQGLLAVIS